MHRKFAIVVAFPKDGGDPIAIGKQTSAEALELAREIRETAVVGKTEISGGVVVHSERPFPILKWKNRPEPKLEKAAKTKK